MTTAQKELYLQIKNNINDGNFSQANALCEEYVLSYPAGIEGWLSYIFAVCEVKSTKGLVKCSVDFTQTDVFEKAIENVNEDDRAKLVNLADTVSAVRNKKGGSEDYQAGLQYFVRSIKALREDLSSIEGDLNSSIEQDKINLKNAKKGVNFFANNFFAVLLSALMIALPFLALYTFFKLSEMKQIFRILALVAGGIVLLVVFIKKFIKQNRTRRTLKNSAEDVVANEKRIKTLTNEVSALKLKHKKVMRIYKFYKKHPRLNERDVARLRTKFDNAYNGL